jgi:hypothetical protein
MQHQPATLAAAFHALAPGLMAGNGPGYSSALYRQTGHFVTGTEILCLFMLVFTAAAVGFFIATRRS